MVGHSMRIQTLYEAALTIILEACSAFGDCTNLKDIKINVRRHAWDAKSERGLRHQGARWMHSMHALCGMGTNTESSLVPLDPC